MTNEEAKAWKVELQKAAKIRTPVGSTYAVALALTEIAMQLERLVAAIEDRPAGKR
jgi:hypothetical protein